MGSSDTVGSNATAGSTPTCFLRTPKLVKVYGQLARGAIEMAVMMESPKSVCAAGSGVIPQDVMGSRVGHDGITQLDRPWKCVMGGGRGEGEDWMG
mgnify:CR=1 FL=1